MTDPKRKRNINYSSLLSVDSFVSSVKCINIHLFSLLSVGFVGRMNFFEYNNFLITDAMSLQIKMCLTLDIVPTWDDSLPFLMLRHFIWSNKLIAQLEFSSFETYFKINWSSSDTTSVHELVNLWSNWAPSSSTPQHHHNTKREKNAIPCQDSHRRLPRS